MKTKYEVKSCKSKVSKNGVRGVRLSLVVKVFSFGSVKLKVKVEGVVKRDGVIGDW